MESLEQKKGESTPFDSVFVYLAESGGNNLCWDPYKPYIALEYSRI